tara:strand:- start:654 stop:1214 length:561 start_codon:yes stop_codon:yes gene_type:complete
MNSKILIIYEYQVLYKILSEIEEYLNFKILEANQKNFEDLELDKIKDYLILSSKNTNNFKDCLVLKDLPIKVNKLIQIVNINFIKKNFAKNAEVKIGKYKLDMNSRKIILEDKFLNLTEKEADLIVFIKSSNNATIKELQNSVWGYSSNIETHTVETHIYRLRKKMGEVFGDDKFIQNIENGYKIN